jgi:ferredoxin-NADP reductase
MTSTPIRIRPISVAVVGVFGGAAYRFFKSPPSSDASLNPHTFTPYTLVDKQRVSSTSAIFTLRHRDGTTDSESVREAWKRGVWSLQIKQPQLQIARAYTPLPPHPSQYTEDEEWGQDVRLLIRQEQGGEVSTYLHRLPADSTMELRGPNIECELPDDIKEVIFLAGGTGIAPAMQVALALGRRTGSRMHLLWANRRREECIGGRSDEVPTPASQPVWWKRLVGISQPATQTTLIDDGSSQNKGLIVQELQALKERSGTSTKGLHVQYFVDEEKTFIKPADVAERLQEESVDGRGSKIIFVSGPAGFIEYWAGKKMWVGGREVQGPLGGVLGQMDLKDSKVFKL